MSESDTALCVYLRLPKESYGGVSLVERARRLRRLGEGARGVYVYFKHAVAAPELAIRLSKIVADAS